MGINKKYSGYQAYDYLEKGKDYKAFHLAKEIDRVESYTLSLSPEEEKRLQRIAAEQIIISLHDHPTVLPENTNDFLDFIREGRAVTAYKGLSVSCSDAVFDNLMNGVCPITSSRGWKWGDVLFDLGMRLCDLAHQDFIIRCEGVQDIYRAHDEGKIALVPSLEACTMIENELDRIDILYGFGVRMMGLVYSRSNQLGSGLRETGDGGLTFFGRQAVERLNKIGMAIDVSHCSEQTAIDAIQASSKPIFCTHIGARALQDDKRMGTDAMFHICAEKGGVIGIEAAPKSTVTQRHPEQNLESLMEHFEYVKDLVGIDHVSFGPDTMYGDHVGKHHVFAKFWSIQKPEKEVPFVQGVENPTEASWNILRWLIKHGYSDAQIGKLVGGNTLRLLREVWVV